MYITIAKRIVNELEAELKLNTRNARKYKLIIKSNNKEKYNYKIDIISSCLIDDRRTIWYRPIPSLDEADIIRDIYKTIIKDLDGIPYNFIDLKYFKDKLEFKKIKIALTNINACTSFTVNVNT